MSNVRLPRAVCAVVGEVLRGSHKTLDLLFESSGAPGDPPSLSHGSKWKEWLFRAGSEPNVDSLTVLGNVLEEFMDLPPSEFSADYDQWKSDRERVIGVLEEHGFRYYRGGRVLPNDSREVVGLQSDSLKTSAGTKTNYKPQSIEELLSILVRGLRRSMHPLTHRRKGAESLSFSSEYDVQDLLHALLRSWVADIRPEEFTPSYAGSSTRMDFLLPAYCLVLEMKFVRNRAHSRSIGDELIIDIEHYRRHPQCDTLWAVISDSESLLTNAEGLKRDLEGRRTTTDGTVDVKIFIV